MALVTWSVYGMRRIRRKHILSKASTLSGKARVRAHVSEPYNKTGWSQQTAEDYTPVQ